jgi:hypothetical protein
MMATEFLLLNTRIQLHSHVRLFSNSANKNGTGSRFYWKESSMFGTKQRIQEYLNLIRPWAMGKDNRGWVRLDFIGSDGFPYEDVKKARLDPCAVIFPIGYAPISVFDMLCLKPAQRKALLTLRQWILNFNTTLAVVNLARRDSPETYFGLIYLLHVGVIGSDNTGGLYQAFREMEGSL